MYATRRWHIGPRGQEGMTLIEVLVATTITAILLTTCYGIYTRVFAHQERLNDRSLLLHQARVLSQRLALECRSLTNAGGNPRLSLGQDTVGRPLLTLTTRAPAEANSGPVRVRYEMAEEEAGSLVLLRAEQPAYLKTDAFVMRPFVGHIQGIEWQVFDGSSWHSDWTGASARALKLTLTFSFHDESVQMETAFDLADGGF